MSTKLLSETIYRKDLMVKCFVTLIVFFCSVGNAFAQADTKVTINVNGVLIRTALDQLQREAKIHFVYDEENIDSGKRVSLSYTQTPLNVVLDDFSKQTSLRYEVKRNLILVLPAKAEKKTGKHEPFYMTGIVTDETGESIIGATIMIGGTSQGTVTDIDGRYSLQVAPGDLVSFTFVGMADKVVKAQAGKKVVNVKMETNATALADVVVTGYQTLSKERATGSYSVISEKSTKGKLETDVLSRIEGMVAGINKRYDKEDDSKIVIRGITTVNGEQDPLYVVDGMPYEGDLASINPSEVQNITVLKDAAASSIYGARAANGVIVISTKRGQIGKTRVSYNGSMKITPKPDMGYLDLMNSSELVDMQIEGFNYYHKDYKNLNPRYSVSPVEALLYRHENGELSDTQLSDALLPYRNRDNRKQIEDEFARTGIVHQHNLSISGGTEKNRYIATINYMGNYGNQKYQSKDRIGFSLKDDVELYKWLSADFGVTGSFSRDKGDNGADDYENLMMDYPSYFMLRDEQGNPLAFQRQKSDYELERLQSIGLMDEVYNPIENRREENYHNNENYYRLHAGLKFNIIEGLTLDLKYQTEGTYIKERNHYTNISYKVRNMINEAAQYNRETGELTLNVPKGGQLDESRKEAYSYTMRAQLNFNRTFGKHAITALGGAERRLIRLTGATNYYMGYDDNSLGVKPINSLAMSPINGTEALGGSFNWVYNDNNELIYEEDRYVSFYANGSYTFDDRYSITGSIRIDQSNLFGTDPKYQYRPLWSVGGSWQLANEEFMKNCSWINRLNLRVTYGIGGNVPKEVGPYMNVTNSGYNEWVGDFGSYISNPPNSQLRWEKTTSTNLGLDFAILNSRLSGTVDYYYKKTTDLLGDRNADPTLGWSTLMVNYGSMFNRGVEVSLQSINIQNRNFTWGINAMFGYNKNELTNLAGTRESVFNYSAYNVTAVGYPVNSLFSYRYAGLDPVNGNALVYNSKGEKVANVSSVDDMVYSGTRDPKYTASLKNFFSICDFDLSFMFVYYGGHVLRDVVAGYMSGAPDRNLNRKALNHWRNPGDENIPGVAPSFNRGIYYTTAQAWYSADVHVKKADYIKLRDVSLSYNLPKSWLKKYAIESAAITCQISNVWWWAANGDIDPEAYAVTGYGRGALTLPNPATYTLGLSLNF